MRHLLQPRVLNAACMAACISGIACYPNLLLWAHRPDSIGFFEVNLVVCAAVLWGFVFAWHAPYTGRPVFDFKPEPKGLIITTLAALALATIFYLWLDPSLRLKFPQEYPEDLRHWLASAAFTLALTQLLLVFAPCDWLMRLFKNRWAAMILTALFVAVIQAMKIHSLPAPISPSLEAALLAMRFLGGLVAVALYLRGGVLLVCWLSLLLQARHLLSLSWTF